MSQLTFPGVPQPVAKPASPPGPDPWPEAAALIRRFRGVVVTDFPEFKAAVMRGAPEKPTWYPPVDPARMAGDSREENPTRGREAPNRKTFAQSAKPRRAKRGGWNSF